MEVLKVCSAVARVALKRTGSFKVPYQNIVCCARKSSSAFDWRDPLRVEDLLTEDERQISRVAREYAQSKLASRVTRLHRTEEYDRDVLREMGALGLLGASIRGHGCAGVSPVGYGLIAREIERVDSGFRSILSVQSSLVMAPLARFGSAEQQKKYLSKLARGELVGCFGLTEPAHGSDPAGMASVAVKGNDGKYRVRGSKTWITNAPVCDIALVWARCDHDNRVRGFILERDQIEVSSIPGKMALRASATGTLHFDAQVSETQVLPKAVGLQAPLWCLSGARYGISWGALGAAEACVETCRDYVSQRTQFGAPLASYQLIQMKLASAVSDIALATMACLRVGRIKEELENKAGAQEDTHEEVPSECVSLVKRNSCQVALRVARDCRDMLGANGISDEYNVMRHMCNLEAVSTYEGTHDIHTLALGRAITGIPAFRNNAAANAANKKA